MSLKELVVLVLPRVPSYADKAKTMFITFKVEIRNWNPTAMMV
jgi:hypothetical protein